MKNGGKNKSVAFIILVSVFLHGSLQYNSDSSIAPSSGLLLIQPQLIQLKRSSGYCESCCGH